MFAINLGLVCTLLPASYEQPNFPTSVQGRAALFVSSRADIAGATGADGVLLGQGSLPAVVARRTMQVLADMTM